MKVFVRKILPRFNSTPPTTSHRDDTMPRDVQSIQSEIDDVYEVIKVATELVAKHHVKLKRLIDELLLANQETYVNVPSDVVQDAEIVNQPDPNFSVGSTVIVQSKSRDENGIEVGSKGTITNTTPHYVFFTTPSGRKGRRTRSNLALIES